MRFFAAALLIHLSILWVLVGNNGNARHIVGNRILVNEAIEIFHDAEALGYKIPEFQQLTIVFEYKRPEVNDGGTTTIGYTTGYYSRNPIITINQLVWERFNEQQRYLLVLHEMGHGIWKRAHDDTVLPDSTPRSVMTPIIFPIDIFVKKKIYYLRELFDPNKCCDI